MNIQTNRAFGTMNSEFCLPKHYMNVPLKDIRYSARSQIETLLNDVESSIIESNSGLMNNYYGLAELAGFSNEQIQFISSKENPTSSLFHMWERSTDLEPKLGKLWEYLTELKRFDVMKECRKAIDRDVDAYQKKYEREVYSNPPVQEPQVTSLDDHNVIETLILTTEDVKSNVPQYYDAFVCYNDESESDVQFVHQLIEKLEEKDLKLCVPGRDTLPGAAKYVAYAELIKSRCRMMIIVLSNDYLKSSACEFQVKFAQALSPCTQKKRIVPVLVESMEIPDVLRYMSLCDFTKKDLMKWFWDRLARSLRQPVDSYWGDDSDMDDTTSSDPQNDLNSLSTSMFSTPPRLSPVNLVCDTSSYPTTEPLTADSPLNIRLNTMEGFAHYNVVPVVCDHNSLRPRGTSSLEHANIEDYGLQKRGSNNSRHLTNENQSNRSGSPESNIKIQNSNPLPKPSTSRIREKFPDIDAIIKKQKKMK